MPQGFGRARRGGRGRDGRRQRVRPGRARQRSAEARAARRPDYRNAAQRRLRRYRQGSMLAVAMVALLLMVFPQAVARQEREQAGAAAQEIAAPAESGEAGEGGEGGEGGEAAVAEEVVRAADPAEGLEEAAGTIQQLLQDFYGMLPKILIAVVIVGLAVLLSRLVRSVLRRALKNWRRAEAVSALVGIGIVLLALGTALSVISGDATALVGSVGLVGLALSWALQAPIESFTGWLLNSFRVYYRVGDRIGVGEVFGDVYRIDLLSTTVWEAGGQGQDKPVQGAQPTGCLATFPNSEILRSTIINYTRHFPYVWDEVTFGFANESDLAYTRQVLERAAAAVLGPAPPGPELMQQYQLALRRRGLVHEINPEPQVFFSQAESWTNATIRYLVPARERRKWASDLIMAIAAETRKAEHGKRMVSSYPRAQVQLLEGSERAFGG